MSRSTSSYGYKQSKMDKIFDNVIVVILIFVGIITLYPIIFVASASISDPVAVNTGKVLLLPKGVYFGGYGVVFKNHWVLIGYRNSLLYTLVGTFCNVTVTFMAAYALSRKDLWGRKVWNWYIAIPMWFGGGLIPTYLTVDALGLIDSPAVLILLGLVSSYNLIICRTYISSLPYELQEAAKIDGASDYRVMFSIILPVSAPILGVLSLYYAVGHWNNYFTAMIYLNNKNYMTLQVFLREILLLGQNIDEAQIVDVDALIENQKNNQVMKYALIIVASAPMLILYPMLQKYFIKGVLIGSVKG